MVKRLLLICLLLLTPGLAQSPGQNQVTASLSNNEIGLNETAILTVKVQGVGDMVDVQPPTATPNGLQFTAIGRQYSMTSINGATQASTDFNFMVTPLEKGRYVIHEMNVTVGAATAMTPSLRLEVTDAVPGASGNSSYTYRSSNPWGLPGYNPGTNFPGYPQSQPDDVLLEADLEPETVYAHQPVYYTMRLLTAVRLSGDPHYNPISPTGFISVQFPQENFQTERDGRQYAASQVRIAFYPLTEGTYTIEPVQLQLRTAFFGQTKVLSTGAKTVKVVPLPKEGRPLGFTGAVGENFEINAYVDRPAMKAGQTAELQVTVKGDGHLDLVPYPHLPDWSGVEKRQLSSDSSTQVIGGGIESKKTYRFRLKMRTAGTYELKNIALSYFNPSQRRYETIKVPPITVVVEPGQVATDEAGGARSLSDKERPADEVGPTVPAQVRVPSLVLWLCSGLGFVGLALSLAGAPLFRGGLPSLPRPRRGRPRTLEELERTLNEMADASDSLTRKDKLLRHGLTETQVARFEKLRMRVSNARFGAQKDRSNVLEDLLREYDGLRKEAKR